MLLESHQKKMHSWECWMCHQLHQRPWASSSGLSSWASHSLDATSVRTTDMWPDHMRISKEASSLENATVWGQGGGCWSCLMSYRGDPIENKVRSKTEQPVKWLSKAEHVPYKPDHLTLITRTHIKMEEKNWFYKVVPWSSCVFPSPHTIILIHNIQFLFLFFVDYTSYILISLISLSPWICLLPL